MRRKTATKAAAAIVAAALLWLASPFAAFASDVDIPLNWIDNSANQTVEYGEFWSLTAATSGQTSALPPPSDVAVTGATSTYAPNITFFHDTTDGDTRGFLSSPTNRGPLEPGHYTFTISTSAPYGGNNYIFETPVAGQLTITKAALGVDLRILTDPSSSKNAIVSFRLTGKFIDNLYPAEGDPSAPTIPAGKWSIVITNGDGSPALNKSIDQPGGFLSSSSIYWPDVPADSTFKATATYLPEGAAASNFTVATSPDVSYTSPAALAPAPAPTTATSAPKRAVAHNGFTVPLWSVILFALVIVGLAITATILAIRSAAVLTAATRARAQT